MLKGHVFKQQVFGHQIFAVFINTFLGGQNGISNNYKNEMEITYSGSILTVQSGVVCIQGRFLEEDTSTDIVAGTDTAYCKLVIEIDLDKQNTETEFVQGTYKIIKSANNYPELTQTNIVKNNSGIYQYELARFKTSSGGISDFQDMRTFLEFKSIYTELKKQFENLENEFKTNYETVLEQLQEKIANVESGSEYVLKNKFKIIEVYSNRSEDLHINYPEGFNMNNSIVVGIKRKTDISLYWSDVYGIDSTYISFLKDYMILNNAIGETSYQIVLMSKD